MTYWDIQVQQQQGQFITDQPNNDIFLSKVFLENI